MANFRKKPIVIEAVQLTWENWFDICVHAGVGKLKDNRPEGFLGDNNECCMSIPTLEGVMTANQNDWIIRGVKGELYACKPDIFAMTYEEVK